jgi:DNA invertase Pin-like site-specific DNA recombinase
MCFMVFSVSKVLGFDPDESPEMASHLDALRSQGFEIVSWRPDSVGDATEPARLNAPTRAEEAAEAVKEIMSRARLSITAVGRLVGVTQSTVTNWQSPGAAIRDVTYRRVMNFARRASAMSPSELASLAHGAAIAANNGVARKPRVVLSEGDVREIKAMLDDGVPRAEIRSAYNVSDSTIRKILHGIAVQTTA